MSDTSPPSCSRIRHTNSKLHTNRDKLKVLLAVVDCGLKGTKIDWAELGKEMGRTKTQTFDQWR